MRRTLSVDGTLQRCSHCKEWFPLENFGGIKKLNPDCRECHRITGGEWMKDSANRKKHAVSAEASRVKRRDKHRGLVVEYLLTHPCVDCGEPDPVVLEFDHIDPETKTEAVCQLVTNRSWERIKEEIDKCEVRCANCHRRKTHIQFGWWGGRDFS